MSSIILTAGLLTANAASARVLPKPDNPAGRDKMAKRIEVSLNVQFYGLVVEAEIEGDYEDGSFDPTGLYFKTIRDCDNALQIRLSAPHASDFYSDHAERIDQLVANYLADEAEARQEQLDEMNWVEDLA